MPYHHLVSIAKRLRQAGMNPVPHVTARQLASREAAEDFLARLRADAQVAQALLVAGDAAVPVGPYESSLQFLETGLLQKYGIRSVGIAGYPEGHPRVPEQALMAALERKIEHAARHGVELFLVSQLCFDAQAVLDWLMRLRARGIALPVRVGVAGPATVRTLLNYGVRCGVGASMRALRTQAISLPRLLAQHGPDKVVRRLANDGAGLGIAGLHCFSFGGFGASARWLAAVAAGRFRLDEAASGFVVED
jgi:methylenetetrahydrofolate reductase (NADPH)